MLMEAASPLISLAERVHAISRTQAMLSGAGSAVASVVRDTKSLLSLDVEIHLKPFRVSHSLRSIGLNGRIGSILRS